MKKVFQNSTINIFRKCMGCGKHHVHGFCETCKVELLDHLNENEHQLVPGFTCKTAFVWTDQVDNMFRSFIYNLKAGLAAQQIYDFASDILIKKIQGSSVDYIFYPQGESQKKDHAYRLAESIQSRYFSEAKLIPVRLSPTKLKYRFLGLDGRRARKGVVEGAFPAGLTRGLVIDDVLTTGRTMIAVRESVKTYIKLEAYTLFYRQKSTKRP